MSIQDDRAAGDIPPIDPEQFFGTLEGTSRGFPLVKFRDYYDVPCSIQQSSLALCPRPGVSALWIGCEEANPRILIPGKGWQPVQMPADYLADTRMHLSVEQVKAVIALLQAWVDTGKLKIPTA